MNRITVLNVPIDDISLQESVRMIIAKVRENNRGIYHVVTVNPESIVTAQHDEDFKEILKRADLAVPDGIGLVLAAKIKNLTLRNRVTGVDLTEELIRESEKNGLKIMFFGGKNGVAQKALECLKVSYPRLIGKALTGPEQINNTTPQQKQSYIETINAFSPDILFIAFGQPKQEKWIEENKNKINAKVCVGIGGTLDYISGNVKRAPLWIRKIGFEWLYRLIREPWRAKRQLRLIEFLWRIV